MAKERIDEADVLRRMLFDHTRKVDEIVRRSKENGEIAATYEEAERAEAWLSKHWRTLDYDGKDFVIPAGWPPGHVRKPQDAPPADGPKDEPPPDSMMHRMLKEKQSGRR